MIKKKEFHKAFLVLKKIWLTNGQKSSNKTEHDEVTMEKLLQRSDEDFKIINSSIIQKFDYITTTNRENAGSTQSPSVFKFIFKSKRNLINFFLYVYVWFAISLTFYGG